jgi:hypothetical protein
MATRPINKTPVHAGHDHRRVIASSTICIETRDGTPIGIALCPRPAEGSVRQHAMRLSRSQRPIIGDLAPNRARYARMYLGVGGLLSGDTGITPTSNFAK